MPNLLHALGRLLPDDTDLGDLIRRLLALCLISLLIGAILSGALLGMAEYGYWKAVQEARINAPLVVTDTAQERIEYYRGVFDVCMTVTDGDKEKCVFIVQYEINDRWYETESVGWGWADYK